jgi:hypothetical protein
VIAYKFLDTDRVAPFTRFQWPEGEWVVADGVAPCRAGIHACRVSDLPFWLGRELWELELEGDILADERKVVAPRGRLTRRVNGWNAALADEFAAMLLLHTRGRFGSVPVLSGFVVDIERFRATNRVPLAAFAAARAAELGAGPRAYEQERLRQAHWLAARLGLAPPDSTS